MNKTTTPAGWGRRPGGGRKPLPPDRRLSHKLWVRMTSADFVALAEAANQEGITVSEAVRRALRRTYL